MHMDDTPPLPLPKHVHFTGLVRDLNGLSDLAAHKYAFIAKLTQLLTRIF